MQIIFKSIVFVEFIVNFTDKYRILEVSNFVL